MKGNFLDLYDKEWSDSINMINKKSKTLKEMAYFTKLAQEHAQALLEKEPKVIILGLDFPEEILLALEKEHVYVIGGSLISSNEADNMVPRDTDAVTKSILGILLQKGMDLDKNQVVLIPIVCDSMRKLSNMLNDKMRVIPIELPSTKNSISLCKRWEQQVEEVIALLEKHLKRKITKSKLLKAITSIKNAKNAYQKLENTYKKYRSVFNGSMLMLVANSYFWESSKDIWANHVQALAKEMKGFEKLDEIRINRKPQLLLIGSPIYFPNYKIPFLLEELEMDIAATINPITNFLQERKSLANNKFHQMIHELSKKALSNGISPSFVENEGLYKRTLELNKKFQFDGVIFHVLKGQIEYDFELRKFEAFFEQLQIPIFRLETDYNYQDIEQLRIRLEAFNEMITQKIMVEGRSA
ncbi:2-hydroxyacyl-CoA dehydratase subunit D [Anaerosacchariphilus polymeriproducens]|uniref:2-hydroxyacyl-CoA dehydratase n=1 Tax=Anaerosacchariphilus polymeriproducens TaxID=1812858 RepID=A0A371AZM3_9FIRM|nr:2-hydroxyacyl-CoA dehydratase family protein [Anaerosacchariphilus polymeriproducens]RDU24999.1 2-hydroxyacyl-CoA dehydratase [Anaerosacchariphilus polymeriproducens]